MSLRTHSRRHSNPTHMRMRKDAKGPTGGKKSSMERNSNWKKLGFLFVCKHVWCVFMIAG